MTQEEQSRDPQEAVWNSAWREGYAHGLDVALGVGYKRAWNMASQHWEPRQGWCLRLARWLIR